MPVNWTSGKARLAKQKLKKTKFDRSAQKRNAYSKRSLRSRHLPSIKQFDRPTTLISEEAVNEPIDAGSTTGNRVPEEVAGSSNTTNIDNPTFSQIGSSRENYTSTEMERKRQALLALPDWAGLHITPESASTNFPKTRLTTPPQHKNQLKRIVYQEKSVGSEIYRNTETACDSGSMILSSSHDSIISPTPINPRIKRQLIHSDTAKSTPYDAPHSTIDAQTSKSNSSPLRLKGSKYSTASQVSSKNDSGDQSERYSFKLPYWIHKISDTLGFSPPTSVSKFEKQRALEIESQHKQHSVHATGQLLRFNEIENDQPKHVTDSKKSSKTSSTPLDSAHEGIVEEAEGSGGKSEINNFDMNRQGSMENDDSDENEEDTRATIIDHDTMEDASTEFLERYITENEEKQINQKESEPENKSETDNKSEPNKETKQETINLLNFQDLKTNSENKIQNENSSQWLWKTMVFQPNNTDQLDLYFKEMNDDERIF